MPLALRGTCPSGLEPPRDFGAGDVPGEGEWPARPLPVDFSAAVFSRMRVAIGKCIGPMGSGSRSSDHSLLTMPSGCGCGGGCGGWRPMRCASVSFAVRTNESHVCEPEPACGIPFDGSIKCGCACWMRRRYSCSSVCRIDCFKYFVLTSRYFASSASSSNLFRLSSDSIELVGSLPTGNNSDEPRSAAARAPLPIAPVCLLATVLAC